LLALLRLSQNDWPFRRVIAVVTNNSLTAIGDDARRAAEWLIRDLQIAAGRTALLDRVQALATEPTALGSRGDHAQRRIDQAIMAKPALDLLATAVSASPKHATLIEWSNFLEQLGAALGVAPFADSHSLPPHELADDVAAWQTLVAQLASLEHLDAAIGQPTRRRTFSDLLTVLVDITTNVFLPRTHDDAGRVRVLSANSARNTEARHLFLGGMSEQAFPAPERAGQLASEADYRYFASA